jgi:hypothetical protein
MNVEPHGSPEPAARSPKGHCPTRRVPSVASSRRTLNAGLAYEDEMNTLCLSPGDKMEGIKAFSAKRAPNFKP